MKKLIVLLLIIIVVLSGCSKDIPYGMTEYVYDMGCKAVNAIEKYENCEADKTTVKDRLDDIADELSNSCDEGAIIIAATIDSVLFNNMSSDSVDSLKRILKLK